MGELFVSIVLCIILLLKTFSSNQWKVAFIRFLLLVSDLSTLAQYVYFLWEHLVDSSSSNMTFVLNYADLDNMKFLFLLNFRIYLL